MRGDDPTEGIASIKMPKTKGLTPGLMRRSRSTAPTGRWGRNSGWSWNFALETAYRRGEVVRFGPQHVRNGRIRIERTHGSD
jgi:hypothetical protein